MTRRSVFGGTVSGASPETSACQPAASSVRCSAASTGTPSASAAFSSCTWRTVPAKRCFSIMAGSMAGRIMWHGA